MTSQGYRCVWLFDGDHVSHPFIRLAAGTMVTWGWSVVVVDRALEQLSGPYEHRPTRPGGADPLRRAWALHAAAAGEPADYVVATLPIAGAAGWLLAKRWRARLTYYPFELLGEQPGPVSRPIRLLEQWLLRNAIDALITQNAERARVYRTERRARVVPAIVRNFKPPGMRAPDTGALHAACGAHPEERLVLYEGALVAGRWLDRLVDAAALLPSEARLVFMGPPTRWWNETMLPRIAASPAANRISVIPPVPHADVASMAAGAACGVIIYDDSVRNNVYCEPGKLSDYLHAGVPVVAPDFPTVAPIIRDHHVGECFAGGNPAAIAAAIGAVLSRPASDWAPALRAASQKLTWESQTDSLHAAISGRDRVPTI